MEVGAIAACAASYSRVCLPLVGLKCCIPLARGATQITYFLTVVLLYRRSVAVCARETAMTSKTEMLTKSTRVRTRCAGFQVTKMPPLKSPSPGGFADGLGTQA